MIAYRLLLQLFLLLTTIVHAGNIFCPPHDPDGIPKSPPISPACIRSLGDRGLRKERAARKRTRALETINEVALIVQESSSVDGLNGGNESDDMYLSDNMAWI